MTDPAKEEQKKTAQDKDILDDEEERSLSTKSASVVSGSKDADNDSDEDSLEDSSDAEAIALATKAADENYVPSQSLLNSSSPYPLIRSVDGISLKRYNPDPSVFSAKDVIVPLRGTLNVPIHVTTSGSIVDYTVDCAGYDIGFGITAEREEGVTVVKEKSRQDAHVESITGRFLVGSVPCAIIFNFDNEYSWFREKKITYRIKITPPSFENIYNGRRIRAKAALAIVSKDKESAETRLENVSNKHSNLISEIERLEIELQEKKKSVGVVQKEENWLKERVQLRDAQEDLLTRRLTEGWEDEEVVKKKIAEREARKKNGSKSSLVTDDEDASDNEGNSVEV